MIHPKRDFLLALALLGLSLCAAAYAAFGPGPFETSTPRNLATAIGGLGTLFGLIMCVNFWYALRLAGQLSRGTGVIASWTILPDQMRAFLAADAALERPRNLWHPKADTVTRPVTIAFGPEIVMADGAMLAIPSAGPQSMRAVTLRPLMLEFSTQLVTARAGTVGGFVTIKSPLRLPIPDCDQAEALRRYYQDILDGRTIVAPGRWILRIKIGLWAAVVGGILGLGGYLVAEATDWRGDDPANLVAMVLLITGILMTPAGLALSLIAWRLHRVQRGQS